MFASTHTHVLFLFALFLFVVCIVIVLPLSFKHSWRDYKHNIINKNREEINLKMCLFLNYYQTQSWNYILNFFVDSLQIHESINKQTIRRTKHYFFHHIHPLSAEKYAQCSGDGSYWLFLLPSVYVFYFRWKLVFDRVVTCRFLNGAVSFRFSPCEFSHNISLNATIHILNY